MADQADYPVAPANGVGSFKDSAMSAVSSVTNGPVAQNVKAEGVRTQAELSKLMASRQTPANPAATGQPLTHYHSFFTELLSWNNPRASAIAYTSIVSFIFAARYLDILRWGFKLTWMLLGITVLAEAVGKFVMNTGITTQMRPRKYYTIPRETLDASIGDVHELINFFVIESQRILFVENIPASAAACIAAFVSYYLIKIVPYWGLALLSTTVLFFAPLVYKTNQELIDGQIKQASDIVNAQTAQLRVVAQKHTAQAGQLAKQYMGDYTAKAQQMIKGRGGPSSEMIPQPVGKEYKDADFPAAPKEDFKAEEHTTEIPEPVAPVAPAVPHSLEEEPLIAA